MSRLREIEFRNFVTLQRGFDLPTRERRPGPYPVVASTSITDHHDEFRVRPPGVVTGRSGSLGEVLYVEQPYWPLNTALWVRDFKGNHPRYVYYFLKTLHLEHFNSGTGVPTLNRNDLAKLAIRVHSLEDQRRVAAVLSAYDDLIEVNQQRIEALEAAAQALYREWFVEMRFPGYESAEWVESELGVIPAGWQIRRMVEVAEVVDCLHSKKPKAVNNGFGPLLHVWNVADHGILDLSEQYSISEEDYRRWISRIEVQQGDCVITKTGRVGAVAQIPTGVTAALGRNLVGLRWQEAPSFLLYYLLSQTKQDEVARLKSSGTIMESLHVKGIEQLRIPVPPAETISAFESNAGVLRKQTEVLTIKNQTLRKTRDLLLPRLISGEVSVEGLPLPHIVD